MDGQTSREEIVLQSTGPCPCLRPIEAFPIEQQGQSLICLRDPQRIAKHMLMLPPAAFFIASLLDGTRTLQEIQAACQQKLGQMLPKEQLLELIEKLDQECYLESIVYQQALYKMEQEYFQAPCREPFHAGGAYEAEPDPLRQQLNGLQASIADQPATTSHEGQLCALVSPHIDLHRGGPGFAVAYRELAAHDPADLYVVLGTGHQSRHSLMITTTKSYNTPLGVVPTDAQFIEAFNQKAPLDVNSEELLHRDEHSIEFQALWLRHALGESWQGKMAPILTGSFHRFVEEGTSPRSQPQVAQALDLLRDMIEQYPGKVVVIAGADMSHVGKRFGHPDGIPPHEQERVEREDREVLDAMETGDAEQFFASIAKNKDRNNVCGLSPIYMMLDLTQPKSGSILFYDRAIEEETESVVTFASAAFYG